VTFPRSGHVVSIQDTIGEGAFSFVYTAQETNSSRALNEEGSRRRFALKKMFLQSSDFERCAQSEVTAFGRFRHANILPLVDSVTLVEASAGGGGGKVKVMYMLFPLMPRGSLRDVLNSQMDGSSRDPLPSLHQVLHDFVAVAEALNVLHTFQPAYVHQDLKPENVLIGADGTPFLMDFGSVRLADVPIRDRSKALKVAEDAASYCTVSYRAPELFDPPTGLLLDTRTDVWAAGCLLFAWFYGYSPYECEFSDEDGKGGGKGRAQLRVVESSHLRVLTPAPRRAEAVSTKEDQALSREVEAILQQHITDRPFLTDVIVRLRGVMEELVTGQDGSGRSAV